MNKRHKVFVSYHHANDQYYKDRFITKFGDELDIIVDKSVNDGDINPILKTETIKQKIRDEYLRDSTVTVVLIGKDTWKRKHVDWEIASSLRDTSYNSRSGVIGIILPDHPDYKRKDNKYNKHIIPPRLADNHSNGFVEIYKWTENANDLSKWIDDAFNRRKKINPDNSRTLFANNRPKDQEQWRD